MSMQILSLEFLQTENTDEHGSAPVRNELFRPFSALIVTAVIFVLALCLHLHTHPNNSTSKESPAQNEVNFKTLGLLA